MTLLTLAFAAQFFSTAQAATFYLDADADSYGDAYFPVTATTAPAGYVADNTDCNDSRAATNPAAAETCSGYDEDCDGSIDEGGACPYTVAQNGHAYLYITSAQTWATQQATCQSYGYNLAEIGNAAENTYVDSIADITASVSQKWWFGLNDQAAEGSFVNPSASPVTYTNWHSGEPNNSGGSGHRSRRRRSGL